MDGPEETSKPVHHMQRLPAGLPHLQELRTGTSVAQGKINRMKAVACGDLDPAENLLRAISWRLSWTACRKVAREACTSTRCWSQRAERTEKLTEYRQQLEELVRESHIRTTVVDDGKGIPPDVRDHIVEPFFTTKVRLALVSACG